MTFKGTFSGMLPNVTSQMLTAGKAQITRRELDAEKLLSLFLLRRLVGFSMFGLIVGVSMFGLGISAVLLVLGAIDIHLPVVLGRRGRRLGLCRD
jgi:hypothetical protein